jgi:hypothetical protein
MVGKVGSGHVQMVEPAGVRSSHEKARRMAGLLVVTDEAITS